MITYSSLISACEKSGEWQLALRFFDECLKDNCRPNVITFNSLITACAQGMTSLLLMSTLERLHCPNSVQDVATWRLACLGGSWRAVRDRMSGQYFFSH